jgi:hypothetical protein
VHGWLVLTVALLAGISRAIGDSVILFYNRVQPPRFAVALVLNGLLYLLSLLIQAISLWAVIALLFGMNEPLSRVMVIVCLGSVPLLFGFLTMAATLGPYVGWVLRFLGWLIVVVAVHDGFGFTIWQAFLCTSLTRLLVEVLSVVFGRPLDWLSTWIWRLAIGARIEMSLHGQRALQSGELQRTTVLQLSNSLSAQLFDERLPSKAAGSRRKTA